MDWLEINKNKSVASFIAVETKIDTYSNAIFFLNLAIMQFYISFITDRL